LFSIPITGILTFGVGAAVLSMPMTPAFSMNGIIYWLVFTLALTILASALPARAASRLTIKDILAYEG
jgi:putative ABC transport system permease protein